MIKKHPWELVNSQARDRVLNFTRECNNTLRHPWKLVIHKPEVLNFTRECNNTLSLNCLASLGMQHPVQLVIEILMNA